MKTEEKESVKSAPEVVVVGPDHESAKAVLKEALDKGDEGVLVVVDESNDKVLIKNQEEVDRYLLDAYRKAKDKIADFNIHRDMAPGRFEDESFEQYKLRRKLAGKVLKDYLKHGPEGKPNPIPKKFTK